MAEYTREVVVTVSIDTNKRTITRRFDSLADALDGIGDLYAEFGGEG